MAGGVRIIAGTAGGVMLKVPDAEVRPSSDRVREALFSVLGELVAGAACLDLYAGSGALGIEALSRGAASCLFVDRARECCSTIESNLRTARLEGGSTRRAEVAGFLRGHRARYGMVFADPPYAKPGGPDLAAELVASAELVELMAPGATLVVESRRGAGNYPSDERLEPLDMREYGDTQICFYRRAEKA